MSLKSAQPDSVKLMNALEPILARWKPSARSGLLPALIEAQEELGWLSQDAIAEIARGLGVPAADAFGVADFYAHLYTHPVGKTFVRVCDDVACYLAGSGAVCAAVQARLSVGAGETTQDGEHTFEIVPCLGHCDHAPVAMIGRVVHENVTPARVADLIR
jgi:NADH:ubiquinone oxidoreductase subunit E